MTFEKFKERAKHLYLESANERKEWQAASSIANSDLFDQIVKAAFWTTIEVIEDERSVESNKRR